MKLKINIKDDSWTYELQKEIWTAMWLYVTLVN